MRVLRILGKSLSFVLLFALDLHMISVELILGLLEGIMYFVYLIEPSVHHKICVETFLLGIM